MKIHLRADETNPQHIRFTVFVNGANAGQLCMRTDEAHNFREVVDNGCANIDSFRPSGVWERLKEEKDG